MSMRTKIKVICLCFIVGAGQAFLLETISSKSVQPNCDKEVADQLEVRRLPALKMFWLI